MDVHRTDNSTRMPIGLLTQSTLLKWYDENKINYTTTFRLQQSVNFTETWLRVFGNCKESYKSSFPFGSYSVKQNCFEQYLRFSLEREMHGCPRMYFS